MINDCNFLEKLKGGLKVVEVSGESCANCLTLMPLLHEVVSEREHLTLVHIEANENTVKIMEHYGVDRVPTVLLLDDGVCFAKATGFQPREIFELWIDAKIEERLKEKN
ncbi:MAG: thioredoxin family protein [Clostridia bacterium]|nr:thioredoxin family protein [Clostridia bacterium]